MIAADRVGSETLLSRIVNMVAQAQRTRAPVQRLADRVAAYFVEIVIVVAVVTAARMGFLRAGAASRLRAGQRSCGPHHCLPLRRRSRDADLDHSGDGAGRAARHPFSQRGGGGEAARTSIRWWWIRPEL